MSGRYFALHAASLRQVPRVPLYIECQAVGSVALAHLDALCAWPQWLQVADAGVELCAPPAQRDAALAEVNRALHELGLIRAWRNEAFALPDPASGAPLATMERAAARFWGTLTLGAHANGFVRDGSGRPAALWIAERSPHKATDPGLLDNLIGGGVGAGQSPDEALVREAFEEAGLAPSQLARREPGGVLRLLRDIPEGLQHEWLHSFDVELPAGLQPRNQDGEVASFHLLPWPEVAELAAGRAMTVDAAVVTLDFLHRRGLLDDADAARRIEALRVRAA